VSSALWITNLDADQLKQHAIVILALQFLEFLGFAKYIGGIPIHRALYWMRRIARVIGADCGTDSSD
jgi:hypothetical protein